MENYKKLISKRKQYFIGIFPKKGNSWYIHYVIQTTDIRTSDIDLTLTLRYVNFIIIIEFSIHFLYL